MTQLGELSAASAALVKRLWGIASRMRADLHRDRLAWHLRPLHMERWRNKYWLWRHTQRGKASEDIG